MFYKCLKLAIPAAPAQLVCQHKNNGCHSYPDPSPNHWRFSLFSVFLKVKSFKLIMRHKFIVRGTINSWRTYIFATATPLPKNQVVSALELRTANCWLCPLIGVLLFLRGLSGTHGRHGPALCTLYCELQNIGWAGDIAVLPSYKISDLNSGRHQAPT